ncbi:MAG: hypothetical protein FWE12_04925 [Oscillospiraceae bacterium]|nr:hypothetical protein [Oscillospiraceae bacterium]
MSSEERILDLIGKLEARMDTQMGDVDAQVERLERCVGEMKQTITEVSHRMDTFGDIMSLVQRNMDIFAKLQLNMENEHIPALKALLENNVVLAEYSSGQGKRVDVLEDTVELHGIEIMNLKQAVGE